MPVDLHNSFDKFVRVARNEIWDTDLLDWVAMTQPGAAPAGSDPTIQYKISDLASGDPAYYGFVGSDGSWFIMKETGGTYRYAKGTSGYSTAWTGRAGQSYDYFDATF